MTAKKLTPKQATFVEEYLIDLNATRAAKAAGYSEKTAKQMGSENLSKPDVQDAVAKAMDARSKRVLITQDDVIINIMRLSQKAEADDKMGDALRGQEMLGKTMAMFTDKKEIEGNIKIEVNTGVPAPKNG